MLTPAQARIYDPVLTAHIRGYQHADYVGSLLFPAVEVRARGGKVLEFGKESFKIYNLRRAPGTDAKRITFGYEGKPFQLVQDSVDVPVPREVAQDAQTVPGVDVGMRAAALGMRAMLLPLEREQAALATDQVNYDAQHKLTLSGTSQWSHANGNPIGNVDAGREAIRATTGMYPNVMVIGAAAWPALKNNAQIVDRVKYTSRDSITVEIVANVLGLSKLAIGKAVVADDAGTFADVWGNAAVLAYAPQAQGSVEEPSYGYTYTLQGNPFADAPWWDNGSRSWVYSSTYERVPVLTGMSAGYLFQGVSG